MPRYRAAIESLAKIVESLKRPENVEPWIAPEVLAPAAMLELNRLVNEHSHQRRSKHAASEKPCEYDDETLTEAAARFNKLISDLLSDTARFAGLTEEAKMAGLLAPNVSLEDVIQCQRADQCPP